MKIFAHFAVVLATFGSLALAALPARHSSNVSGATPVLAGEALVLYSAGLEGLMPDAKDAGFRRALSMLDERLLELGHDFGDRGFPAGAVQMAYDLLTRPACLRLAMEDPRDPRTVRAQLTVRFTEAGRAQGTARALAELLRQAGMPIEEPAGGSGAYAAFTPLGPLSFGADSSSKPSELRIAVGAPVAESFHFAESGLPADIEPAFFLRYDPERMGSFVQPMIASMRSDDAQLWSVLELLGLVGEDAPPRTWAMGYGPDGAQAVARAENFLAAERYKRFFEEEPLDALDLARIPEDATLVHLFQIRPTGILGVIDHFNYGSSAHALKTVEAMTGVDLKRDLLDHLGPTAGLYWSTGSGGGGLTSSVAFIETSAAREVEESLSRLMKAGQAAAAAEARGRVSFREWAHRETVCTSVTFPGLPVPLELSYALSADTLFVTLNRGALRAALEQLAAESSILNRPELNDLKGGALQEPSRFGFFDSPYFLERGYGSANLMATGLANALRSPYEPGREPGELLPSMTRLRRDVRPWISSTRVEGRDLVTRSSFDASLLVNGTALAGTPLSRSYMGIMGLGVVSSIAIPNLMSARLSANESAAVATLRSIASAQAQAQASAAIDTDADGAGEYGFFGELSGVRALRVAGDGAAAWGRPGRDHLNPPVLSSAFGQLIDDGSGESVILRSGYVYKLWLPGEISGSSVAGVAERAALDAARAPGTHPDGGEVLWCCYAWPQEPGTTGNRVFFVNQEGEILQFANLYRTYGGLLSNGSSQPAFDAAFSVPGDVSSPVAAGAAGSDGNRWELVR